MMFHCKSQSSWLVVGLMVSACLMFAEANSDISQRTYLIKGRAIESVVDAATQLRQFLPASLKVNSRCQRYAIMLNTYKLRKDTLDLFMLIDIANMDTRRADSEFAAISIDQLRKLYIDGVRNFLDAHYVNSALVDIYECLKKDFLTRDAMARSFLNDPTLKQIVSQYQSIVSQPARLLNGDKHPQLQLEELHQTIKNSVARWLRGGHAELGELFRSANARGVPVAQARTDAGGRSQANAAASLERQASPKTPVTAAPGPQGQAPAPEAQLSQDDINYLGDVFSALIATYETLPIETPLNERCRTYSSLIDASQEQAKLYEEGFVTKLVADAKKRIPKAKQEEPFVPGQAERSNFIFMLQVLYPDQRGADVWLDMVDCAGFWEQVDPEASEFLNGKELAETLEHLQAARDQVPPPPAPQPKEPHQAPVKH